MFENTLWVEKYRPSSLDEYVGNDLIKEKAKYWLERGEIPHLLFSGKPGTGKTTLAKILAKSIDCDLLYVNASLENGIEAVRDRITTFATSYGERKWKVVILDEADFISLQGQAGLRQVIEQFSRHTRFILTCNYVEKIIDAIQSRCTHFSIEPPNRGVVAKRCIEILQREGVEFVLKDLVAIVNDTYPDTRKTINVLQSSSINGELVVDEATKLISDYGSKVIDELKNMSDPKATFKNIRQILADSKLRQFDDLYRQLFDSLEQYTPDGKRAMCILHIAESQYRSAFVVDKEIEISACLLNIIKELK